MDPINLLFSFQGRIGRGQFWLAVGVWVGFAVAVFGLTWLFVYAFDIRPSLSFSALVQAAVFIPIVYSAIATGIKRLHDRGKHHWWLLVFYLGPLIGLALPSYLGDGRIMSVISLAGFVLLLWAFVELGCLRGSIGANPYGPDPVAPKPAQH
jgi:uncharacterized membrane protein YhaH (DUF805 family)